MTIEQLRQQGYIVHVLHRRLAEEDAWKLADAEKRVKDSEEWMGGDWLFPKPILIQEKRAISGRGGYTRVEIFKDEQVVAVGEAWCSLRDNFSKKIGRDAARSVAPSKTSFKEETFERSGTAGDTAAE